MRGKNGHLAARALTPAAEIFCQEMAAHNVQSRAYLRAYPHALEWPSAKQSQYGRRLKAVPEVAARIAELRASSGGLRGTDADMSAPVASDLDRSAIYAALASDADLALGVRVAAFQELLALRARLAVMLAG